jgi:hypothetical protein
MRAKLSFDTDASFPKLKFTFGGFLDEDVQTAVDELFGSAKVKDITGETPRTAVKVPQIAAPKAEPVAPKPAVKVVEEEESPPAAPAQATKRGFGAPKATEKKKFGAAKAAAAEPAEAQAKAANSLADEIAALVGEVADD